MRANFVGRIEKNHTTFIRIKTNKERKDKNQLLVLPVEVEVSSGTYYHSGSQQGVWASFGHQNPKNSPFRTPKIFCREFLKKSIASIKLNTFSLNIILITSYMDIMLSFNK